MLDISSDAGTSGRWWTLYLRRFESGEQGSIQWNTSGINHYKVTSRPKDAINLQLAYHQIILDPKSEELTTFSSPQSLYCYEKFTFGLKSVPEILRKFLENVIRNYKGTSIYTDNILDLRDHDMNL